MKQIILFLATLVLIPSASIAQAQEPSSSPGPVSKSDPSSWSRYTVKGEDFSVMLPTRPAMTTTKALRQGDHARHTQRQLETSLDGVLYTIEVYENPKPRQSLDQFIAAHSADLEYDRASEHALTIDGFSGKEYSSANKQHPLNVRFFATETRLYRFLVRGPGAEGRAVREFLASIKLGKNTNGVEVFDGPGTPLELDGERIIVGKEVDVRPRLLEKPAPIFTEEARANQTAGTVILRVVFTSKGTVENIRVLRGLPNGLTERCIEAAKKITFIPATKDGHPVSMWMQLEYNFLF